MKYEFRMLDGEYWWGGTSNDGKFAPYNKDTVLERNFNVWASNQTMPMYISNMGRCIWSEYPFACLINDGCFYIDGEDVVMESLGSNLREAYLRAMELHFPPCGSDLETEFFSVPQYNTWMQLTYNQTQEGVLQYAKGIIANGFKPGILMIDEGWQKDYGNWTFDRLKFPNPKEMIDELHALGFKVMLWIVPYVRPDGLFFVRNTSPAFCNKEHFLRTKNGDIAIINWWNGYSAIFDFTKECDRELLDNQLIALIDEFGVDGFKFDGGALGDYYPNKPINGVANDDYSATERNIAWNEFGRKYR